MLTAFQCEVVAFIGEGDIICRDCAINALDEGEADGLQPLIRYSLDEMQSERNYDLRDDLPEGCTDECEPFVESCGSCGDELTEPYHYGHDDS